MRWAPARQRDIGRITNAHGERARVSGETSPNQFNLVKDASGFCCSCPRLERYVCRGAPLQPSTLSKNLRGSRCALSSSGAGTAHGLVVVFHSSAEKDFRTTALLNSEIKGLTDFAFDERAPFSVLRS